MNDGRYSGDRRAHRGNDRHSSGRSGQQGNSRSHDAPARGRSHDAQKPAEGLVPLPESIRLKTPFLTHPGLALDKYAESVKRFDNGKIESEADQKRQKRVLDTMVGISQHSEPKAIWQAYYERQQHVWNSLNSERFDMHTIGPLAMHLSRSTALENAGICLHHLYGFPLIPGSGLKGMTRAWASNAGVEIKQLEELFGSQDQAGKIIFYDAIPAAWPELSVDVVSNHHPDYYADKDAPGDWENPNPVYFLTVKAETPFAFALAKAHADVSDACLSQVSQWLQSALTWAGAGAKTNAGYGLFKSSQTETEAKPASHRQLAQHTLELISPAFFAGANQDDSDCDLRPASLRGMLRWWWRTLHSGFLNPKQMLAVESAIFGSASQGGALQIRLEVQNKTHNHAYHKEYLVRDYPPTSDRKTSQGLHYHSFGMDERNGRRRFLAEGASWKLSLSARKQGDYAAEDILKQAKLALELLCQFGAIGAKQRKAWGSFADQPDFDLERSKQGAKQFRQKYSLPDRFQADLAQSASLETMLPLLEIQTPWTHAFWALHQIGMAAQGFAKSYKHQREKQALGLPRRIGNPQSGNWRGPRLDRHASPTQFHLAKNDQGQLIIRALFFVSPRLPDAETSQQFLSEYRGFLDKQLRSLLPAKQHQVRLPGTQTQPTFDRNRQPNRSVRPGPETRLAERPIAAAQASLPKSGDTVKAVLLEEKTKKEGWKAQVTGTQLSGAIINSDRVQGAAGDQVDLIINSANGSNSSFKWPG